MSTTDDNSIESDRNPTEDTNDESIAFKSLKFSWIIDRDVAASARPGRYGPLTEHLQYLRQTGISTIINLCVDPLEIPEDNGFSFEIVHVPIVDGDIPSEEQVVHIFDTVEKALDGGGPCLVHCRGGVGRTATVLATVLMKYKGLKFEEALEFLKKSGRRTQNMQQYNFLQEWELLQKKDTKAKKA